MRYPLRIELRSSRRAVWLNAAIHSVAAFSFLQSSFHPALIAVVIAGLVWSLRRSFKREAAKGLGALTLEDGPSLRFEDALGERRGVIDGRSADFGWALWLRWKGLGAGSRGGALMLLPDNLNENAWRGLRIWMRHKTGPEPGADD